MRKLFKCVSKYLLSLEHCIVVGPGHFGLRLRDFIEADHMLVKPLTVGMGVGHRLLQFLVGDDASLGGIYQEHAPRFQARFP